MPWLLWRPSFGPAETPPVIFDVGVPVSDPSRSAERPAIVKRGRGHFTFDGKHLRFHREVRRNKHSVTATRAAIDRVDWTLEATRTAFNEIAARQSLTVEATRIALASIIREMDVPLREEATPFYDTILDAIKERELEILQAKLLRLKRERALYAVLLVKLLQKQILDRDVRLLLELRLKELLQQEEDEELLAVMLLDD